MYDRTIIAGIEAALKSAHYKVVEPGTSVWHISDNVPHGHELCKLLRYEGQYAIVKNRNSEELVWPKKGMIDARLALKIISTYKEIASKTHPAKRLLIVPTKES